MSRSYPPDVLVLDYDSLLHARLTKGKRGPTVTQAKTYRLAEGTFAPGIVTPELVNPTALADALRRVRIGTGRWDKASVLLPDSWFRINLLELATFNEKQGDALALVRWSLKRTLPMPPEELRLAWQMVSRTPTMTKVLVVSAVEKTLAAVERLFADAGIEIVLIEPLGLNLWNAITSREETTAGDRLLIYVREREFTTAVFRGSQPLFIRSRNLSAERNVQQEIRLSANYLRESLQATGFQNCYVAGDATGIESVIGSEFNAPVKPVELRDFVDGAPDDVGGFEAELTACTGVFAA